MIKKLKTRFIVLAMISLIVLLSLIVAGMNIVNYEVVVRNADDRLQVLEENSERLLDMPDEVRPDEDKTAPFFRRGDMGSPAISRDEAEESRFFMVTVDENGSILKTRLDRISAVDSEEAAEYANKALATGKSSGFIGDFRFHLKEGDSERIVTFLDCGRTLRSFYSFLKASIIMSLIGLVAVFFVILYFASRIVRPVAESYEKQKRFITDAGHEIKTPLAIIKANIDLMDMEIDNCVEGAQVDMIISDETAASLKENLSDIDDQITRLTGLTNDLVYLSRMEETGQSLAMTDVPLSDIIEETISSFGPLAEEKGKVIEKDIAHMVTIKGSGKELEKLISILMENSIKYSAPSKGTVDEEGSEYNAPKINAELRKEGRTAVIEIRNLVESEITNEQLSHVFERFYRTDSSRNSMTGGHGIGLSMANAIVNAHGGKITARTATGHDFIVTVTLPT